MERRQSGSSEALLDAFSSILPYSSCLKVPHIKNSVKGSSTCDFRPSSSRLLTPQPRAAPPSYRTHEEMVNLHRGELSAAERYEYVLSKAQLKASSSTSALLAGFAMVCLVELQYDAETPRPLLVVLGVVTALLVSVHLLALMMSTCILPYMEASGATHDSPHIKLKIYIDLSWFFSTCVGLILFLVEIGLIFYVKFRAIGFEEAGWITSAILVPVLFVFVIISCFIHRSRASHSIDRMDKKVSGLKLMLVTSDQNISLMKVV